MSAPANRTTSLTSLPVKATFPKCSPRTCVGTVVVVATASSPSTLVGIVVVVATDGVNVVVDVVLVLVVVVVEVVVELVVVGGSVVVVVVVVVVGGSGTLKLRLCDGRDWVEASLPVGHAGVVGTHGWQMGEPGALATGGLRSLTLPARRIVEWLLPATGAEADLSRRLRGKLLLERLQQAAQVEALQLVQ